MGKANRRSAGRRVEEEQQEDRGSAPMLMLREALPVLSVNLMGPDEDGDFVLTWMLPGKEITTVIPAQLASELGEKLLSPHVEVADPSDVAAAVAAAEAETGLVMPGGVRA